MSLNGLDDVKVKEAHDTAAAEPGGWFLLKYASRDEIELLGRGNGGIVEIRNAIAQFEEPAPLFGFLRYRRRNVLIKYVPEDCSRLVQARVTVHFSAVTERFSPHDTVFPITSSKELRDTSLSAACSLHTASGSISSSTSSLRRRRLMEIAEEAEEDSRAKRQSTVPEERPSTAKAPSVHAASIPLPSSPQILATSTSYRSVISDLETFPPPPREPEDTETRPRSPLKTIDDRRKSLQSTRPDLYSSTSYGSYGKPKVKLGPRPSLDVGGRPHTSSAASQYRPVSTLPAGLKLFSRGSKKEKNRPKSHVPIEPPSMTISPPPPVPETMAGSLQVPQQRPHTSNGRPSTSSGVSIRPLASPKAGTFPRTPTVTPEKARLMKALELRKKREMAPPLPAIDPAASSTEDNGLPDPTTAIDRISMEAPTEAQDTLGMLDDMAKGDDSGIAFETSSTLKTDESDATRSDSYPVSPVGPSERAESTRASSISESTDGTIQEIQNAKPVPRGSKQEPEEHAAQAKEVAAPLPKEDVADDTKEPEFEDLPRLQPVAYEPPRPVTAKGTFVESVPEEAGDSTPTDVTIEPVEFAEIAQNAPEAAARSIAAPEVQISAPETSYEEIGTEIKLESQPIRSEIEEWKVPRSKFSVQDLLAASEAPAILKEPLPISLKETVANPAPPSPVGSTFSADTKRSLTEDDQQENGPASSKRMKRRALVEPIRTDIDLTDRSAANSEAHFSSDDEFMDELQSAVFQEAKPISVSKSPISPVFPSPKKKTGNRFSRVFSSPMRKETPDPQKLTLPDLGRSESSRSVSASAAYLNRINQQPAKPLAKKVNLGSGISQRIKALEKLSSKAPGAPAIPGTTTPSGGASPAFFSVSKGSRRGTSKSPSIAERADSLTRNTPSPSISRESSPETLKLRERSGSVQSRLNAFNSSPIPTGQAQKSRPESISVTARIIRDPNQPFPKQELGKDPSEYAPLDLKQSPLVIDHQKAIATPTPPPQPIDNVRERRLSTSSRTTTKSRRSSITVVKDLIKEGRASFAERRRSINLEPAPLTPAVLSPSGRSPSRPPSVHASPAHQRPMSVSSRRSTSSRDAPFSPPPTASSGSPTNDEKDKKSSRATRMLRRMSSSLTSSRKTITHSMSPTVREESEPAVGDSRSLTSSHPSNYSMTPITTSTDIGDVNVQFPDTLLWKRRSMLLDSQGYLILSPALASGNPKDKAAAGATRRFHLSEFRQPVIPDVEMQELPNSVVLDFVEGGGLQVACEDRAGQGRILNVLQDAHRTWAAYGQ